MNDEAITAFARAVARMTDPFAERARVLAELGIDEAGWRALEETWFAEIARRDGAGDRGLGERFRAVFEQARKEIAAARQRAPTTLPVSQSQAYDAATTVAGIAELKPALPFKGSRPVPPSNLHATEEASVNVNTTAQLDGAPIIAPLPFRNPKERP